MVKSRFGTIHDRIIQDKQKKKIQVRAEIIETINIVCTGDHTTCTLGYCQFNQECGKPFFVMKTKVKQIPLSRLKSFKKQISKSKKAKSTRKEFKPKKHHLRISEILGESIFDHDLVKDNPGAILSIQYAGSLKKINHILDVLYQEKYGRPVSHPQGRAHYHKYIGENAIKKGS